MNDQPPPKPALNIKPSASTVGSAVGGMTATIIILLLQKFGVDIDAVSAASIGGGMAALVGWLLTGGRASDTE